MGHAEPDEEDELLTEFIAIRKKSRIPCPGMRLFECGFCVSVQPLMWMPVIV